MSGNKLYDVIIVGGSYAGLSAAMSLGRALRPVLVIDNGEPCNRQTPHSHNMLTQDGSVPAQIASLARMQVERYETLEFVNGTVVAGSEVDGGFRVSLADGTEYAARKLLLASGVRDIMPAVPGFAECWGITVLHCPYCHGYEVRGVKTGVLANGPQAFHMARLIQHWSGELTLYTNGPAVLESDEAAKLAEHGIAIDEREIAQLVQTGGQLKSISFKDGSRELLGTLFARIPFEQSCSVPAKLGTVIAESGLISVDEMQRTSVPGVYAAGDNCWGLRSVATAIGAGNKAGAFINHELIGEDF
jgi:thioredoxin reductase